MATRLFDMDLNFLGSIFSLKGMVDIGVTVMAVVILYLISVKYAKSAKEMAFKTLSSFGFTQDESTLFSDMASGLVKTAGLATILVMAGKHIPLIDPVADVGLFILKLIGYAVALALPAAIVYLARTGFNK